MALLLDRITAVGHNLQMIRSLRHRDFRWFWISTTAQAMARGMQFLILGWLVLVLTDSASQLGLMVFLYGIPNLAFVLFGGILADRIDRRMLLITSQAAVTLILIILAALTTIGLISMWHIYIAIFLLGILQALNMPSRMAIVSDLVGRDDLMNAVVLNSAVMNTGRILGPAAAGGIIEVMGIGPALFVNAACYLVGTGCLLLVHYGFGGRGSGTSSILADLRAGLRYFWSTPVTFTVIGLGFAFGFFGMPYIQVLPAYAKEVMEVGAGGAGLLITGAGVGSLAGTVVLASLGNFRHKNWLLIGSIFMFCISLFAFAWSSWFWLSWAILFFVGMGSIVPMGTTILQLTVPTELQGRVLSLWYLSAGLMFIGGLPMTLVADAAGWTVAIAGGAVICLVVGVWLGLWRPTLRRLKL
ncbi:MAG: MFS transporter [Chloroflexi bacterium]|nr:MFS transporter [Chloroflexota bacterium]MCI0826082.1 MFS transporter [Chloroflexota bacterium]MCI0866109.1 MFS transporter [Chloroflexota bacterium]MCI0880168.1 MFS transporter [Chloroflexota bacterium]